MRTLTLAVCCLSLLSTGCLMRRFIAQESRYLVAGRYVFNQPVEEVWPAVRAVLTEDGYSFKESEGSYEIVTEWRIETGSSMILGTGSKYLAFAERLEADRCIIRFVRVNRLAEGSEEYQDRGVKSFTMAAQSGRKGVSNTPNMKDGVELMARRDLKMEWKVLARVRPEIAAESEAEIDRRLPEWLGENPESVKVGKIATKLPPGSNAATVATAMSAPRLTVGTVASAADPNAAPSVVVAFAPSTECQPALHGEDGLLTAGRLLVFGETPGTYEIPRYVGQVACRAARSGLGVVVGVEIAADEQPRIDRYLASQGTPADREQLLSGGFWRRAWQDGRSSEAVLELLEQVRVLRAAGSDVSAFAFDDRGLGGNARQQALATRVFQARQKKPEALMLVLTGNVQARIERGTPWDASLVPMAARLLESDPKLLSLDAHYSGGAAWTCRAAGESKVDCAEGYLPAPQRSRILGIGQGSNKEATGLHLHKTYVNLDRDAAGGAHHGIFYLGRMHAAPPAVSDPQAWTKLR